MSAQQSLLIIFIKNPELGKVKTRLAKTLGDQKALATYHLLLQKTQEECSALEVDKALYYSSYIDANDNWNQSIFTKHVQEGADLGERMLNAFQKAYAENYQKVVIIGSDCYDLSSAIISEAFSKLDEVNTVIGPANDGGYYLLGTSKFIPELFQNKSWSQEVLIEETKQTLTDLNHSFCLLEELTDVDNEEDLKKVAPHLLS